MGASGRIMLKQGYRLWAIAWRGWEMRIKMRRARGREMKLPTSVQVHGSQTNEPEFTK